MKGRIITIHQGVNCHQHWLSVAMLAGGCGRVAKKEQKLFILTILGYLVLLLLAWAGTLLRLTSEMNRAVGYLLDMEVKRMGELGGGDPLVPPRLVS